MRRREQAGSAGTEPARVGPARVGPPRVAAAACNGCRLCELACSFRLHGSFQPDQAGIRVVRDHIQNQVQVKFVRGCDGCAGEAAPHCARVCPFGALHQ